MLSKSFREMFMEPPYIHIDLDEYWNVPSTEGWQNKSHRYLYHCLREIYHLRLEVKELRSELKKHTG